MNSILEILSKILDLKCNQRFACDSSLENSHERGTFSGGKRSDPCKFHFQRPPVIKFHHLFKIKCNSRILTKKSPGGYSEL
ncbi:MAG: hypothetical protein H7281_13055 [Bacteriovorax sp.]|nr:hypothetical protein [Bacteriovorax sp.]